VILLKGQSHFPAEILAGFAALAATLGVYQIFRSKTHFLLKA
jgi:hypothetical protein